MTVEDKKLKSTYAKLSRVVAYLQTRHEVVEMLQINHRDNIPALKRITAESTDSMRDAESIVFHSRALVLEAYRANA